MADFSGSYPVRPTVHSSRQSARDAPPRCEARHAAEIVAHRHHDGGVGALPQLHKVPERPHRQTRRPLQLPAPTRQPPLRLPQRLPDRRRHGPRARLAALPRGGARICPRNRPDACDGVLELRAWVRPAATAHLSTRIPTAPDTAGLSRAAGLPGAPPGPDQLACCGIDRQRRPCHAGVLGQRARRWRGRARRRARRRAAPPRSCARRGGGNARRSTPPASERLSGRMKTAPPPHRSPPPQRARRRPLRRRGRRCIGALADVPARVKSRGVVRAARRHRPQRERRIPARVDRARHRLRHRRRRAPQRGRCRC